MSCGENTLDKFEKLFLSFWAIIHFGPCVDDLKNLFLAEHCLCREQQQKWDLLYKVA